MEKIIILAPHPDDGELAAGAALNRFCKEGKEVWYVVFSPCNISLPEGYEKGHLYSELGEAVVELGIKSENLIKHNFSVRHFPNQRQEILEELISLRNKIKPDLVMLPNSWDVHQDHRQVHLEGIRAFKFSKILGYELPWNTISPSNLNFYIGVDESDLNAKVNALSCYKTQKKRHYFKKEFVYSLATVRGVQCNKRYAEAFECIRWNL